MKRKRTLYMINDVDNPETLWVLPHDRHVTMLGGNFSGLIEGASNPDYIRNHEHMRSITKREAKSLFPKAFTPKPPSK